MSDSQPPTTFAVLNGKYKYAALNELIEVPSVELRLSLPSGKPLDPYYLPLFAKKAVLYNASDLDSSLIGADVVLSYTASQAGLLAQLGAIRKAHAAGVKLFFTCEYTLEFDETDVPTTPYASGGGKTLTEADLAGDAYPLVKLRREAVQLAEELGLPVLQVHLGIVPENFLIEKSFHPYIDESSPYNWNLKQGKVTILGDGNQPITITTKPYYRQYLAHLLTTTPLAKLQTLKHVYIAGETLTQNEIIKIYENKFGKKLDVTYVTGAELGERERKVKEARVHNYWTQWPEFIQLQVAKGKGVLLQDTTPSDYAGPKPTLKDILWETESPGVNE